MTMAHGPGTFDSRWPSRSGLTSGAGWLRVVVATSVALADRVLRELRTAGRMLLQRLDRRMVAGGLAGELRALGGVLDQRLLDRVPAELVAQRRVDLGGVRLLLARALAHHQAHVDDR